MKLYLILIISFAIGYAGGLGLEFALADNDSKIYNLVNKGKLSDDWIPYYSLFTLEELRGAIFSTKVDIPFMQQAYLQEVAESVIEKANVGFTIGSTVVDPDPDVTGDNYFVNQVKTCTFHSDESIDFPTCVICQLNDTKTDPENPIVVANGTIDLEEGYTASSQVSIPLSSGPEHPENNVKNIHTIGIAVCEGTGEGCIAEFWKQEENFEFWVTYSPGDLFSDVFGRTLPGGAGQQQQPTLLDVLDKSGGGVNGLARESVAALLNAESVNYAFSSDQVISKFQEAFDSNNFKGQTDEFAFENARGCPFAADSTEEQTKAKGNQTRVGSDEDESEE